MARLKWLRILFPEVQLLDFIQQKGFIQTKSSRLKKTSSTGSMGLPANHSSLAPSVGFSAAVPSALNPASGEAMKEVFQDVKRGVKSATLQQTAGRIDPLFSEVLQSLKNRIHDQSEFLDQLIIPYKKAILEQDNTKVQSTILLSGLPGTGKKSSLAMLIALLYDKRLIGYKDVCLIDLERYTPQEIRTNFLTDLSAAFADGWGTVCFTGVERADSDYISFLTQLFEEGWFRTPEGQTVNAINYHLIILYDQQLDVTVLPPALLKHIEYFAQTEALSMDTLGVVAQEQWAKYAPRLQQQTGVSVIPDERFFHELAQRGMDSKAFGQDMEEGVENSIYGCILDLRARGVIEKGDTFVLSEENHLFVLVSGNEKVVLMGKQTAHKETIEDVLAELTQLTGLGSVKTAIHELIETVHAGTKRRLVGQKTAPMALHMIFSGNPGTGKTTVARLIARIFTSLGLLSEGQLIEVTRQDLVGQYVGSTAPKTMQKLKEAIGGVLFIDEAYTLSRGNDPFGQEALDTLVKGMEDNRGNLVVVVAGYTKEMEEFIRSNPGFKSRFPFVLDFEDYTPAELLSILQGICKQNDFSLDPHTIEPLMALFEKRQIPGKNDSGNGRLVRNLFEQAVRKQSSRLNSGLAEDGEWRILRSPDFGLDEKKPFDLEERLLPIVGVEPPKVLLRDLKTQLEADLLRKVAGVKVDTSQSLNMIFLGNPGTGKTTFARVAADMLKAMGILKQGQFIEVDRSALVSEYVGKTAPKTTQVVESALGGVLFIDEAYSLIDHAGPGKEAIDTLVRLIELHKDNLVVILAGYTEEMKDFMRTNPGLASRFPNVIEFPDYNGHELLKITEILAKQKGFSLNPAVGPRLADWFEHTQVAGKRDNGNGRLARNVLEKAIRNQSVRIVEQAVKNEEQMTTLLCEDFELEEGSKQHASALGELESIVGLSAVKAFVTSLFAQINITQQRKSLGLPVQEGQTLHMIFKGNPGTGKTTVARLIAKQLKELGILKRDTVIEVDRSGLVAGYVGQTALKVKQVVEDALGGVLFIDEAYALAQGGETDFGREAIDTLVKAMDDYRDRLIVILAGYDEDMESFLEVNPGLRSRFPNVLQFEDYSPDELMQIAHGMLQTLGYRPSREALEIMTSKFHEVSGRRDAGNGRFVRNYCERAIRNQALRLSNSRELSVEVLTTLLPEDLEE
ncbi:AAA family ATPase [Gorillibacterium sp. CAU 1737]|uniref:AAA family ATPase n=1 Tax=Gorillibacterium sp. CAU 1737 TaxID=3140362 RepID=UPI00326012DC